MALGARRNQEFSFGVPAKKHPDKCATPRCKNLRYKARRSHYCCTCISRKLTRRDPVKKAYWNMRGTARRRGIEFTISLDYFRAFCLQYDYTGRRGRKATSATIDRVDSKLGYVEGNIQLLSLSENVRKARAEEVRNRKQMYVDAKIAGHTIPSEEPDPF